ncbi:hypothetical protein [Pseudomonas entomophila]|nr:hypothetical protein [Pseudomonas entomophila]
MRRASPAMVVEKLGVFDHLAAFCRYMERTSTTQSLLELVN